MSCRFCGRILGDHDPACPVFSQGERRKVWAEGHSAGQLGNTGNSHDPTYLLGRYMGERRAEEFRSMNRR